MSDLISLETYKQAKALTSAKDDERLSIIVSGVNQLVRTYCNTTFNEYSSVDKVEFHSVSKNCNAILLKETPIISITSVEERLSTTEDYETLTESEDYELDSLSDVIYRIGYNFPSGVNSVKVTYTAGYTTLPEDLKLAMIDLVHYYYKDEYKQNRTIGSASMQNLVTSSLGNNTGFPDHIRRVLDWYRHI